MGGTFWFSAQMGGTGNNIPIKTKVGRSSGEKRTADVTTLLLPVVALHTMPYHTIPTTLAILPNCLKPEPLLGQNAQRLHGRAGDTIPEIPYTFDRACRTPVQCNILGVAGMKTQLHFLASLRAQIGLVTAVWL